MKKFLNAAERFVPEMIEGILAAHPGKLTSVAGDLHCLVKGGSKTPNKVGIASGGGSGHLPLFLGYIGDGLLDGCSWFHKSMEMPFRSYTTLPSRSVN